jgi:ATP-dependent Clp protease ATP-binding subunit ClpA
MSEARELRHDYVGSEHLLHGLLREGRGVATQVLIEVGVNIAALRSETLRLLGTEIPHLPDPDRARHTRILLRASELVQELLGPPAPNATRVQEIAQELETAIRELRALT